MCDRRKLRSNLFSRLMMSAPPNLFLEWIQLLFGIPKLVPYYGEIGSLQQMIQCHLSGPLATRMCCRAALPDLTLQMPWNTFTVCGVSTDGLKSQANTERNEMSLGNGQFVSRSWVSRLPVSFGRHRDNTDPFRRYLCTGSKKSLHQSYFYRCNHVISSDNWGIIESPETRRTKNISRLPKRPRSIKRQIQIWLQSQKSYHLPIQYFCSHFSKSHVNSHNVF